MTRESTGITLNEAQVREVQSLRPVATEADEPSSLWKDAYEHRVAIGATALGVAAIGTGLYLSRGKIANMLAPRSQEVLIVEAAPFMGKAMKSSLEAAGHRVTWVTEIDKLRPLTGLADNGALVPLKMNRFHTAFIDPNHVTKAALDFDQLAPFFHKGNVRTIGTSVMSKTNEKMLSGGVDIAATKSTVLMSLVGKQLDLQQAVRSPRTAQGILTKMDDTIHSPEWTGLRETTEQLLRKFISGG